MRMRLLRPRNERSGHPNDGNNGGMRPLTYACSTWGAIQSPTVWPPAHDHPSTNSSSPINATPSVSARRVNASVNPARANNA